MRSECVKFGNKIPSGCPENGKQLSGRAYYVW